MIDISARNRAVSLLQELQAGELLSSAWEEAWPKRSKDPAVRSVGYWVWTLFDDHVDAPIRVKDGAQLKILDNSIQFLSSRREFNVHNDSLTQKIKTVAVGGVEWIGCELPWHSAWPFPPEDRQATNGNQK